MMRAAEMFKDVSIPTSIELKATHTVNVVMNGAEVLAQLGEPLQQMIVAKTSEAIRKHINPLTGETTEGVI